MLLAWLLYAWRSSGAEASREQESASFPLPLAGEVGVRSTPGEGLPLAQGFPDPHLIALRAICPLPQGERGKRVDIAEWRTKECVVAALDLACIIPSGASWTAR
jgi:hypothetical protein